MGVLIRLAADDESAEKVAEASVRLLFAASDRFADDAAFLLTVFTVVRQLAFSEGTLKVLVQHNGVATIINSIGAHPENAELMHRCIQTLETIASASTDYATIVVDEGGRDCIQVLMEAYEDDDTITEAGRSALLYIDVLDRLKQEEQAQAKVRHKPARPTG